MNTLSSTAKNAFPTKRILEMHLEEFLSSTDVSFLVKVVERQIYSERQRYTVKKQVDDALLSSSVINLATEIIKKSCEGDGPGYVGKYLSLLSENLKRLVVVTGEFCKSFQYFKENPEVFWGYLKRYIPIADIDNAHAMYLSSDNWDFSVFQNILSQIASKYPDPKTQARILKGGIIDIRTHVYVVADAYVNTATLHDHVVQCTRRELVHEQLYSPILFFPFSKPSSSRELNLSYNKEEMTSCSLIEAYQDLYHARYLYDSLEYFGYYGIVRNAIAELCNFHFVNSKIDQMGRIAEYITLYQFNFCNHYFKNYTHYERNC